MPLKPGKKNFGKNVREMEAAGHPADQSLAAAYRELHKPKRGKKK